MSGHDLQRLHLIMGLQCNARCVMCYQPHFSPRDNMPAEIFREHLLPLYSRVKLVKIQGGEPSIMDNCRQFAELISDYPQVRLAFTTNGIVLSEFWRQTLLRQGGLVNFSLNAARPETYEKIVQGGNFARALENLRALVGGRRPESLQVSISAVILQHNVEELESIVSLGADLGVDKVDFIVDNILSRQGMPAREQVSGHVERAWAEARRKGIPVQGLEAFARLLGNPISASHEQRPARVCPLPFNSLVVDQKGDVRVCCETWQVIGNTYRTGIEDILASPRLKAFQDKVLNNDYGWCSPKCPDNPAPVPLATWNKYLYLARRDPVGFAAKVAGKIRQGRRLSREG